jgi:uncharacterized protein YndB with AHSA1/START domain
MRTENPAPKIPHGRTRAEAALKTQHRKPGTKTQHSKEPRMTATAAEVTVEVQAPPPEVFRHLTDQAYYVRWMGSHAVLDARPGGRYEVSMGDGFRATGRFETVEPPWLLVFTWGFADDEAASHTKRAEGEAAPAAGAMPAGSTRVTVTLAEAGAGTRLKLQHDNLPTPELVAAHQAAWGTYLPRLATVLAGRDPGPDPHSPGEDSAG